ncbi:MAG: GlcNAc-PI de-N-acetylase, partial [Gaiellales bacterium]|nr:GlcNAc-PI de-N-acetylase [Gaiellales bacterium]
MTRAMARTLLCLSPHPDDEVAGMPATLMALRDAGWRVVNLACGLGRPEQHGRRLAELEEACRRAGFELLPCDPPLALSAGDDLIAAEGALVDVLARILPELSPSL